MSPSQSLPGSGPADHASVPARPAASVLLLRDTADGMEVFHVRRAATMAFSADATAFPGGRTDPDDDVLLPSAVAGTAGIEAAARLLGLDLRPADGEDPSDAARSAARLLAAAVRELFEETGVLLARTPDGRAADAALLGARRDAVERHEASFAALLAHHRLHPDTEALVPWQRWITPAGSPRRYDTAFFLSALPEGQAPERLSSEAAAHGWSTPARILSDFRSGLVHLMAPTWAQLRALDGVDGADEALARAAALDRVPVVQLSPAGAVSARSQEFDRADEYLDDLAAFRATARVRATPDNIL